MSKVDPVAPTPYVAATFVSADTIVKHYGVTGGVTSLPTDEQQRYNDYALQANKQTETVIYRYIDKLPLAGNDEAQTYAEGMAFWYAIWLKQADDGANNVPAMKELWEGFKAQLIEVFQSQPKEANTRRMVSNGYPDLVIPYSQSYGLSDIL